MQGPTTSRSVHVASTRRQKPATSAHSSRGCGVVSLLQLGSCDTDGSLWFDYYKDSACSVTLGGSSAAYPNDGTYHTTSVSAQSPCVTLPNNSHNVYALTCTAPADSAPLPTANMISGTWAITQYSDAQCTQQITVTSSGRTGDCVSFQSPAAADTSRLVNCFGGSADTFFVVDYMQRDCPSSAVTSNLFFGSGPIAVKKEPSACTPMEAGVFVKVTCPSSSSSRTAGAMLHSTVAAAVFISAAIMRFSF